MSATALLSTEPSSHDAALLSEVNALAEHLLLRAQSEQNADEKREAAQMARLMDDPRGKAFLFAMVDEVFRSSKRGVQAERWRELFKEFGLPQYPALMDRVLMGLGGAASVVVPSIVMPQVEERMRARNRARDFGRRRQSAAQVLADASQGRFRYQFESLGRSGSGRRRSRAPFSNRAQISRAARYQLHFDQDFGDLQSDSLAGVGRNHWGNQIALAPVVPCGFAGKKVRQLGYGRISRFGFDHCGFQRNFGKAGIPAARSGHCAASLFARFVARAARIGRMGAKRASKRAARRLKFVWSKARIWRWKTSRPNCTAGTPRLTLRNPKPTPTFAACWNSAASPKNAAVARVGVASHNLFDVALALILRDQFGVRERVEIEMLEGMANHQARAVHDAAGELLLYAPVVGRDDFLSALAYLIRRLDENTAPQNFLHDLFALAPGSAAWEKQARAFAEGWENRHDVSSRSRRLKPAIDAANSEEFKNEPDSDWTQPATRKSLQEAIDNWQAAPLETLPPLEDVLQTAQKSQVGWENLGIEKRGAILRQAAQVMSESRFESIACMRATAKKAIEEADAEVSEAIDFARYYAHFEIPAGIEAKALGVVAVTPPWNFPYAIPCGGVLAALMAGNTVIFKPAPETVAIAHLLAQQLWQAGVPRDVLQFFPCDDGETGKALICDERVASVILTGSLETARLFQNWRPDLRLFAETSGKNALVITAQSDREAAIKDLVKSAFGHAGQKCSAASLGILEAEVYDDPDFRRQLRDAAKSLTRWPRHRCAQRRDADDSRAKSEFAARFDHARSGRRMAIGAAANRRRCMFVESGHQVGRARRFVVSQNRMFRAGLGFDARQFAGASHRMAKRDRVRPHSGHSFARPAGNWPVARQSASRQFVYQSPHHGRDCPAPTVRRLEAIEHRSGRQSRRPELRFQFLPPDRCARISNFRSRAELSARVG